MYMVLLCQRVDLDAQLFFGAMFGCRRSLRSMFQLICMCGSLLNLAQGHLCSMKMGFITENDCFYFVCDYNPHVSPIDCGIASDEGGCFLTWRTLDSYSFQFISLISSTMP